MKNLCLEPGPRRKEEDKERTVMTIKKLCEVGEREYGWMKSSTKAVGTEAEDGSQNFCKRVLRRYIFLHSILAAREMVCAIAIRFAATEIYSLQSDQADHRKQQKRQTSTTHLPRIM